MLYFKEDLISCAYAIIKAKETSDDAKAWYYLAQIEQIISLYLSTGRYDSLNAKYLDDKICKDYPLIEKLSKYPSSGNVTMDSKNAKGYPDEINALDFDQYGILISTLIKKNIIRDISDAMK